MASIFLMLFEHNFYYVIFLFQLAKWLLPLVKADDFVR